MSESTGVKPLYHEKREFHSARHYCQESERRQLIWLRGDRPFRGTEFDEFVTQEVETYERLLKIPFENERERVDIARELYGLYPLPSTLKFMTQAQCDLLPEHLRRLYPEY